VLLLHLSRFEADPATGMAHKRHTPVALDLTLRLRHAPAAAAAAERTPPEASSPEAVPPGAAPPTAAASSAVSSYELRAVVSHLGQRCYQGHYKCVERDSEGWVEYDDACVTPLGFDPTAHDEHSRGAYILFYQKLPLRSERA
jgi:ubiquitin C-terminal hydrolase